MDKLFWIAIGMLLDILIAVIIFAVGELVDRIKQGGAR